LIGTNGSGKSNLIAAIGLLRGAPQALATSIREGGGVRDWLWKGTSASATATLEVGLARPERAVALRYRLSFAPVGQRFEVTDERLEDEHPQGSHTRPYFYFGYENGRPMLNVAGDARSRALRPEDIDPQQSVLSQRKDPDQYPELTYIGTLFSSLQLYRDWNLGRDNLARRPQPADMPNDHLTEDGSNLGLVLNSLRTDSRVRRSLLEYLRKFYADAEDVDVKVEAGTVQVFLQEKDFSIPATRLSDGTLHWLALLAVLLNPTPPPLICLEEPEIGLHPDIMPTLAELLREASARTQLIVTTHSVALVDALTEIPDAVLVCEKTDAATILRRLDRDTLSIWLEKYRLGQLWQSGEIGGNRW
jgi:predicted ATPase